MNVMQTLGTKLMSFFFLYIYFGRKVIIKKVNKRGDYFGVGCWD